jgi:hypothetical protein
VVNVGGTKEAVVEADTKSLGMLLFLGEQTLALIVVARAAPVVVEQEFDGGQAHRLEKWSSRCGGGGNKRFWLV